MAETIAHEGPLGSLLPPGTYSVADSEPGLSIEARRSVVQVQLIARNNDAAAMTTALARFLGRENALSPLEGAQHNGLFMCATGPLECWVLAENRSVDDVTTSLTDSVGQSASIFDQSAGRAVIRLTGAKARDVLAKGTSLDLHERAFPAPAASHTVIEHISALVALRADPACYDISIPLSYASSFVTWLREAAREYGYVIRKPDPRNAASLNASGIHFLQ